MKCNLGCGCTIVSCLICAIEFIKEHNYDHVLSIIIIVLAKNKLSFHKDN